MANEQKKATANEQDAKNSEFLRSLSDFSPESEEGAVAKSRKSKGISIVPTVAILLCLVIFFYSSYLLIKIWIDNESSGDLYTDIENEFLDVLNPSVFLGTAIMPSKSGSLSASASTPSSMGSLNTIPGNGTSWRFQQMLSKLESLRSTNSDTIGYISVSNTGINYPVVKYEDNSFYLDHGFNKTTLKSGAIFADWRCEASPKDNPNLVIYGHNMANGTMFAQVKYFIPDTELFNQATITIYAFDGIYTYEIFAIYYADADEDYLRTSFPFEKNFLDWCKERKSRSIWQKDITFSASDRIVTLSTCINGTSEGRIAVHGILRNVET